MKFAITYDEGNVFQHYGQTKRFKVFDSESGESSMLDSAGYSHGTLANLLSDNDVESVLCGGIGDGARKMLKEKGIKVYAGQKGDVDTLAKAFVEGKVEVNNFSTCDHDHDCHCGH